MEEEQVVPQLLPRLTLRGALPQQAFTALGLHWPLPNLLPNIISHSPGEVHTDGLIIKLLN